MTVVAHPGIDERRSRGEEQHATRCRRRASGMGPTADRSDPVALLEEQNDSREPDLVPVRHGRMLASPFTFYRGAAKIMAADLKDTPRAGLNVQLCGDAHLSNFGVVRVAGAALVFDLNDFDETLPGPFEYDVKRLAASFTIAARNNGFTQGRARDATRASVTRLPRGDGGVRRDAHAGHLVRALVGAGPDAARSRRGARRRKGRQTKKAARRPREKRAEKASRRRASATACRRCPSSPSSSTAGTGSSASRRSSIPLRELAATLGMSAEEIEEMIRDQFRAYRATLPDDRRHLLERFEVVDVARKVVGVGSVGTRAFIVLLQGRDQQDPLFLQVKEATASVLEDHLPEEPGTSSPANGSCRAAADAGRQRHLPRLDEGRRGRPVPLLAPTARHEGLGGRRGDGARSARFYARALRLDAGAGARPLRRPGRDRRLPRQEAIASTKSIADFSERYADQNEQDYEAFTEPSDPADWKHSKASENKAHEHP